jgi:hypothetical protein
MGMSNESVDVLGMRRLRAAADMAYASAVHSIAVDDATFQGAPHLDLDPAVLSAAAYATQTRLAYQSARADHERAMDAAAGLELVPG